MWREAAETFQPHECLAAGWNTQKWSWEMKVKRKKRLNLICFKALQQNACASEREWGLIGDKYISYRPRSYYSLANSHLFNSSTFISSCNKLRSKPAWATDAPQLFKNNQPVEPAGRSLGANKHPRPAAKTPVHPKWSAQPKRLRRPQKSGGIAPVAPRTRPAFSSLLIHFFLVYKMSLVKKQSNHFNELSVNPGKKDPH